jgi:CD109 antigen
MGPTATPRAKPLPAAPADLPSPPGPADGYVAVAPRVLRSGQVESVSLAVFQGDNPASDVVKVALLQDERSVAETTAQVTGRARVSLALPELAAGDYQLRVAGQTFAGQSAIRVEEGTILFVETDKPIYKPGQTVHIRVLGLDAALKPARGEAVVEVMDAKDIKVFKKVAPIDYWGMASVDLPLSTEPNLGVWKIQVTSGKRTAERDMRVERYVLPKYEVKVDLRKAWALASEPIAGTVAAEYSFGKPVKGELEIIALRYAGVWEEYARVTRPLDGKLAFDVPAVGYAAGSPVEGGMAEVRLDVKVREQATGYEETTSRLVTIAPAPIHLRVIPESSAFKPSLPFNLLVVAETPDKQPIDTTVQLSLSFQDANFGQPKQETHRVATRNGVGSLQVTPPPDAVSLTVSPATNGSDGAGAMATVRAGFSPSGAFIHVEQLTQGPLKVGDTVRFKAHATREVVNFYYEVIARGSVVFSEVAHTPEIVVELTPAMAPEARLLVYQLLQNGEVAADYLPFKVQADYPQRVEARFEKPEVRPGEELDVLITTEGAARIGLAAVDRSVFILAENRLNLQQVFDELERLYMEPRAELHEVEPIGLWQPVMLPGARETFQEAGVVVLSNRQIPEGKRLEPFGTGGGAAAEGDAAGGVVTVEAAAAAGPAAAPAAAVGQAEPQRVRQFFPETWIWATMDADASGRAARRVTAPDSITTWKLRAVSLSKEKGLGIGEAELRVFQPFFVTVDLPYAAVRGEQFPVRVALYNYQPVEQEFTVELDAGDWFELLGPSMQTVSVAPNSVGAAAFPIRSSALGVRALKVTARGGQAADAIVKELIVEPEGVQREVVENLVLAPGVARSLQPAVPPDAVPGSARAYIALTGNVLAQAIEGLEKLLQRPFGCGEQNMILFAPNVFVTRYLKATRQLKPEVMAKAEKLMLTGYQRELIYRRAEGSFSAFGESDAQGSLWLTAFVLKTFAQARDIIFVDDSVLTSAATWIKSHQNGDGSFDPFGFVHHEDLLGGLSGKTALSAFVAIALREARDDATARRAGTYLEAQLDATEEPYAVAIVAYALALLQSSRAQVAHDKLMKLARETDEGLFWGASEAPAPPVPAGSDWPMERAPEHSAVIETTAYAALALLERGDMLNAGKAVRWLAAQRNAYGGFGSTQDTIVALQAMAAAASRGRADIDTAVTLSAGAWRKEIRIDAGNADVLQVVEAPADQPLTVEGRGKGQVMAQWVQRFNLPAAAEQERSVFKLDVRYDTQQVAVDDLLHVAATIKFTPPQLDGSGDIRAGMVVLDVAVPTGFEPVAESIDAAVKREAKIKRFDVAGRKVIFYVEDMLPDEELRLQFDARALYPVRARAVASQVYSYYRPAWKAEHLGAEVLVGIGRA